MNYLFEDEMKVILEYYNDIMDDMKVSEILTKSTTELAYKLSVAYKQLYFTVKSNNAELTKGEISYKILKLRRMLAQLDDKGLLAVGAGAHYSAKDHNHQFPRFDCQNPTVEPTEKTINRIRVKALQRYIEIINGDPTKKEIKDLRSLRSSLIKNLKLDDIDATRLTRLYGSMMGTREVNIFSQNAELN